jgi:hypothetical protein
VLTNKNKNTSHEVENTFEMMQLKYVIFRNADFHNKYQNQPKDVKNIKQHSQIKIINCQLIYDHRC